MFNELKLLYEVVEHNDFEELVKKWKERFLKFYAIIDCNSQCEWERVYRTCLYLEAMYGYELAKSFLFYGDTELEVREEKAVGVLLSEAIEYYIIKENITKDELLNELDKCIEKLKKEGNND